ncbi:hypothetical protein CPLU01_04699 [Colletotrichum plurivorum]|uniref:Uncharacterized protein n=1 Tax=Colletotrichum plurivorum TaxID=2175906 RepID=A0A8H6KNF3_9PEZI|nr:hypothetical protein CPLU01_04699 [Colletotrichum plurivorum]
MLPNTAATDPANAIAPHLAQVEAALPLMGFFKLVSLVEAPLVAPAPTCPGRESRGQEEPYQFITGIGPAWDAHNSMELMLCALSTSRGVFTFKQVDIRDAQDWQCLGEVLFLFTGSCVNEGPQGRLCMFPRATRSEA